MFSLTVVVVSVMVSQMDVVVVAAQTDTSSKMPPPFFLQDSTDSLCLAGEDFKRCSIDTLWYATGTQGTYIYIYVCVFVILGLFLLLLLLLEKHWILPCGCVWDELFLLSHPLNCLICPSLRLTSTCKTYID